MPKYTETLNLRQTDMATDANDTFNFKLDLDDNWDKIDSNAKSVNEIIEELKNKKDTSGFSLFDLVEKDHILTFEESKGFALLGSWVHKEPLAGSRYGYPDFYAKCLEEKEAATPTEITLGDSAITAYVHPNGHVFFDIADKDAVDAWFSVYGEAWYYGIDTVNEKIFLPRGTRFQYTNDTAKVNEFVEAGFEFDMPLDGNFPLNGAVGGSPGFLASPYSGADGHPVVYKVEGTRTFTGKKVQTSATKKLLYMVVGNTEQTSAVTEIVDITTTENDTTPLFTAKYFDFNPNHLSWLKAGNQQNSGGIYTTTYNELVKCLTDNPQGLKVVDTTQMTEGEDYTDFWKVDQINQTFTTPIRTGERILIAKKEATEDDPGWFNLYSDGWLMQGGTTSVLASANEKIPFSRSFSDTSYTLGVQRIDTANANKSYQDCYIYEKKEDGFKAAQYNNNLMPVEWVAQGYTSIPQPADYTQNANLYFKVANAVQNLELLDVGATTEALADKADKDLSNCTKPYVTETYSNGNSFYRLWSDGYIEQCGISTQPSNYGWVKANLLKNYNTTNYNIKLTPISPTANAGTPSVQVFKETLQTDSFDWHIAGGAGWSVYWSACGY